MPPPADRLTIRDLAALLDVPSSTVYRWADEWEAGARPGPTVYRDRLRPKQNRYFRAAEIHEWVSASGPRACLPSRVAAGREAGGMGPRGVLTDDQWAVIERLLAAGQG